MSRKQTPSDFLKQIIGRPVVVKLNSGADYRGTVKTSTICYCMFDILRYCILAVDDYKRILIF